MAVFSRFAQPNDLFRIVEIYNQAVATKSVTGDTKPVSVEKRRDWFDEHTQNDYPILVAVDDETVLGWISLSPYRKGKDGLKGTVEVSYFIDNNHHRRGIGSMLLNRMLSLGKELGYKTIFAILFETNRASVALLEKHHFKLWGILPEVVEIDGVHFNHAYYGRKL